MTLDNEKKKFETVAKRILKEKLSTNVETLNEYKEEIITAYNFYIDYVQSAIIRLKQRDEDLKNVIVDSTINVKAKWMTDSMDTMHEN